MAQGTRKHAMIQALFRLPERCPGRLIVTMGLLLALAYTAAILFLPRRGGRLVVGDGVHYYVYVRSAVFDHDLQFANDYTKLYGMKTPEDVPTWMRERTVTGHVANMMSVGPPLLWMPLFLLVTGLVAAGRLLGIDYPLDGFGWVFQASAGYSGIIMATAGVWISYRLAARYFDRATAIWSTLAIWLASSALYYSGMSPTYSHSASMLVVSAFLYVWATSIGRQTAGRYALVGLLAGFVALVRWQDAIFLVVPLVDAIWHVLRPIEAGAGTPAIARLGRAFVRLAVCGVAAIVAFAPQMLVWKVLYGSPLTMPQTGAWMQWSAPFWWRVLFSDLHGLFTWTPVLALAVVGMVPLFRRDRRLGTALAAALLVSLWANGSVVEWWAGEAYGARRFVSCFAIFVLGFCGFASTWLRTRPRLLVTIGVFVILNGLLLLQYQLFMHGLARLAPYPSGFHALVVARFLVPFRLLGWLLG